MFPRQLVEETIFATHQNPPLKQSKSRAIPTFSPPPPPPDHQHLQGRTKHSSQVQTEYPASLASIHKMKLGVSTNSSLPCQSTSSSLQVADWSLRRNLSGSKSFDISLDSSPSSTSSGVRHRRGGRQREKHDDHHHPVHLAGGMRRDSVGLSTSSTTSSSPASATSPGRWVAKAENTISSLLSPSPP